MGEMSEETKRLAAQRKELKAMPIDDLKELVCSKGVKRGTKEVMIEGMLSHEANIRAVVKAKKDELSALAIPELKKLCASEGITGALSKSDMIKYFLDQWFKTGGLDTA